MTKPTDAAVERNRQMRKATIWTNARTAHLIKLYRRHECLWNHFISSYKSKDSRKMAVDDICKTLHITKFDFAKKIHNLRNQFNSEMKKLERRIEEMGGNTSELGVEQRCRWGHFDSLMFLRPVIEPRPGGYHTFANGLGGSENTPQIKKRISYEYVSGEDSPLEKVAQDTNSDEKTTEYQFEDATDEAEEEQMDIEEFQGYDEVEAPAQTEPEESYDEKYDPLITNSTARSAPGIKVTTTAIPAVTRKVYQAKVQKLLSQQPRQQPKHSQSQEVIQLEDAPTQHWTAGTVIELPPNVVSNGTNTSYTRLESLEPISPPQRGGGAQREPAQQPVVRDQWDAFGELIASEFRHLNSDSSRKKLKRKIMQAMLQVGEEDDEM